MKTKQAQVLSSALELVDDGILLHAYNTDTAEKFRTLGAAKTIKHKEDRPVTNFRRYITAAACLIFAISMAVLGATFARNIPAIFATDPTSNPLTNPPATTRPNTNLLTGEISIGDATYKSTCQCGDCAEMGEYLLLRSLDDAQAVLDSGLRESCALYRSVANLSTEDAYLAEHTILYVFFKAGAKNQNYSLAGMQKLEDGSYTVHVNRTKVGPPEAADILHFICIEVNGIMEEDASIRVAVNDILTTEVIIDSLPNAITDPIACLLWSETYDAESGTWISSDGDGAYGKLTSKDWNVATIPYITLGEPLRVILQGNGSINDVTVYSRKATGEFVQQQDFAGTVDALSHLPAGRWYVAVSVTWDGKLIQSEMAYERHCYEYLFALHVEGTEKPEEPTASMGLEYTLSDDGSYYIVTGYGNCLDPVIVIPGRYKGLPVKEIRNGACNFITTTEIYICEGVTTIAERAFANFSDLTTVHLPSTLTTIGDWAFSDCTSLTDVYISDLSAWCGIDYGDSIYACPMFYASNLYLNGELLTGELILPKDITFISSFAFYGNPHITEVAFPDGVTSIGQYAFSNCTGLQSITIPDSVTQIDECAFYGCTALKSVIVPDSVKTLGYSVFRDCTSLASAVIGNGITVLEGYLFSGCSSLTDITIGIGVQTVRDSAFARCFAIERVYIFDLAKWAGIDFEAYNTTPMSYTDYFYINGELAAGQLVIPEGTTRIGDYAFSYFGGIDSVVLPDTVTQIGNGAFQNSSITSIELSSNLNAIGAEAFRSCPNLESISIPDSVSELGYHAFFECINLVSAILPGSITTIPHDTFSGCISLTEVQISGGILTIGDQAFAGCTSLTDIVLPDGLTALGSYVFSGCTALKTIAIPDSVTDLGSGAFTSSGLTEIRLPDAINVIHMDTFKGCRDLVYVSLPANLREIGSYAFSGCTNLDHVTLPDQLTAIYNNAFSNCAALTEIVLPDSVTTMGEGIFISCTSLVKAVLPKELDKIEAQTFLWCSSLSQVNIPDSVTEIARNAFSGCSSLENVILPNGLLTIGEGAFSQCAMKQIIIPTTVTRLERHAFSMCRQLESIVIPITVTYAGWEVFLYNDSLTAIYCENPVIHADWNSNWNNTDAAVYWGYEWEYVDGVPTPK